jgi:hypothetical protein
MATKKEFVDGKPSPVPPKSNEGKMQDFTPEQWVVNKDPDYDEKEHTDAIAAVKEETGLEKDSKK